MKKEIKKDMPVKEGMQSEAPTKQSPVARPGVKDVQMPEGGQSKAPDHVKKDMPKEGPFVEPVAHPMYDPKKDTL